jgi:hypothetical protein
MKFTKFLLILLVTFTVIGLISAILGKKEKNEKNPVKDKDSLSDEKLNDTTKVIINLILSNKSNKLDF